MTQAIDVGTMEAGREMDALIESHVFTHLTMQRICTIYHDGGGGWEEIESLYSDDHGTWSRAMLPVDAHREPCWLMDEAIWQVVRPYSTDIAAAWQVVDALIPKWDVQIDMSRAQNSFARLVGRGNVVWYAYGNERGASGAPLAICRAALKAVSE